MFEMFVFDLQTSTMEEDKYFFDSLRQTSDAPKKTRKMKDGKGYDSSFTLGNYVFLIFILFLRQPDHYTLPGDLQEEALVQCDPRERPDRRPHFPFPTGA